jgi:hypothetical protein
MVKSGIFKQKHIPFIGAFNQLLGAAMGWASMGTFVFSAIAAWNTPTVGIIRNLIPWLNIGTFILFIIIIILSAMWIQHKYVLQSTIDYWRGMFYDQNPSLKRQKALEQVILTYVIQDEKAKIEAKRILDESENN